MFNCAFDFGADLRLARQKIATVKIAQKKSAPKEPPKIAAMGGPIEFSETSTSVLPVCGVVMATLVVAALGTVAELPVKPVAVVMATFVMMKVVMATVAAQLGQRKFDSQHSTGHLVKQFVC